MYDVVYDGHYVRRLTQDSDSWRFSAFDATPF